MPTPKGSGAADAAATAFAPVWLLPADVKRWLRLDGTDTTDDDLLQAVCAQTEPYVQRCRPEFNHPESDEYAPDAEAYQGAVMYAARQYRRRNSPAGIESFGETTSFVSRWDPDIDRALQTGSYARPVVT